MAMGKTHAAVSLGLAASVPIFLNIFGLSADKSAAVGVGLASGVVISPDLDIKGVTLSEGILYKLFWPLGALWFVYWYPYAILFKHRGISHSAIWGTLSRVIFALPLLAFANLVLSVPLLYLFLGIVGLYISDLSHLLFDL